MEQKVKEIMSKIFEVPVSDIKDDASTHTIATWDSLRHLDLVLALENEFGIKFGNEEIPTLINYQMILDIVRVYQEQ